MQILTQLVFSGIALGMIYAVIAFGYQLTFATSDTLNFGQGDALMLGALVALRSHAHLGTDSLVSRLPVKGKKICLGISHLLMLWVCWLMLRRRAEGSVRIVWRVRSRMARRTPGASSMSR